MTSRHVTRIQGWVKFVIAWLIVVYLFDVLSSTERWIGGAGTVVVALLINIYTRKKAAASVKTTKMFYFWLYVPVIALMVLPLGYRLAVLFRQREDVGWWEPVKSLLPFVLKLGVPVVALIWVYMRLGRWGAQNAEADPGGS